MNNNKKLLKDSPFLIFLQSFPIPMNISIYLKKKKTVGLITDSGKVKIEFLGN